MLTGSIIQFLAFIAVVLVASDTWSFTVIFKDGRRVEGRWIGEDTQVIRIKDQNGLVWTYNKSQLDMGAMAISSRLTVRDSKRAIESAATKLTGLVPQNEEVLIQGDGVLKYTYLELDSPPRLAIDFHSLMLASHVKKNRAVNSALYGAVRVSQIDSRLKTVRVVIDLKRKVPFEFVASETNALLVRLGEKLPLRQNQLSAPVIAALSPSVPHDDKVAEPARPNVESSSGPKRAPDIVKPPKTESLQEGYTKLWSVEAGLSNVYETNVNHDEEDIVESVGIVSSLNTRFRNRVRDPNLIVRYEIGYHEYSNTDQWDRVSHNFRTAYLIFFGKKFQLENNGEIALNGSSEDRELGDQYAFRPVLRYHINSSTQFDLIAAYRYRKFDTGVSAVNRFGGVALTKEFDNHEITGYYRYEYNNSQNPRNDRYVHTYFAGYTIPVIAKATASLGARLRDTRYVSRLVEIEVEDGPDIEFLRRDKKWNFEIALGIPIGRKFELVPEYEYEYRTSNDPEKPYDAHEFWVSIVYSLW